MSLNGDSPFLDQAVIDEGIRVFKRGNFDLLTNVKPRTFPPGCSVEIVKLDALKMACAIMPVEDREHVIKFLYSLKHLAIGNFSNPVDLSGYRLTVDDLSEFELASRIIKHMDRPHWEYSIQEVVDLGNRIRAFEIKATS
jgi:spore coat polysaccharide biosynthesis protein SpsF (cytidylyltransferase family)